MFGSMDREIFSKLDNFNKPHTKTFNNGKLNKNFVLKIKLFYFFKGNTAIKSLKRFNLLKDNVILI